MGMEKMELGGSKEKAKARILSHRDKKIKMVEHEVAEQLKKLEHCHQGYLYGVKHLLT